VNKIEINDCVVIKDQTSHFCGNGGVVVSSPFDCEIKGVSTAVVAVKVFDDYPGPVEQVRRWATVFLIVDISNLVPDINHLFDMLRLKAKFGYFRKAVFLEKRLDFQEKCAFCRNNVQTRIELKDRGVVVQYDVCSSCAMKRAQRFV
jgi:hypothetical protein